MIVLNAGGMHFDDAALASLDPLGHLKRAWTPTFRGFHALTIDPIPRIVACRAGADVPAFRSFRRTRASLIVRHKPESRHL